MESTLEDKVESTKNPCIFCGSLPPTSFMSHPKGLVCKYCMSNLKYEEIKEELEW